MKVNDQNLSDWIDKGYEYEYESILQEKKFELELQDGNRVINLDGNIHFKSGVTTEFETQEINVYDEEGDSIKDHGVTYEYANELVEKYIRDEACA